MSGPTRMTFPGSATSASSVTPRQSGHPHLPEPFPGCPTQAVLDMVERAYATMLRPPLLRLLTDSREWRQRWR